MTDFPSKPAQTDTNILPAIANRWSPVIFSSETVEDEKVAAIFESARWAPSAFNEQPWRYVYAQKGDEGREVLEDLLLEGNAWAKDAGMLLIGFASTKFVRNGKENAYALHDTGCATGYMFLQLESLGLIGHEMAGFRKDDANALLGVPPEFVPTSMMAIGYPGDRASAAPELQEREKGERQRHPVESFAFKGGWQ